MLWVVLSERETITNALEKRFWNVADQLSPNGGLPSRRWCMQCVTYRRFIHTCTSCQILTSTKFRISIGPRCAKRFGILKITNPRLPGFLSTPTPLAYEVDQVKNSHRVEDFTSDVPYGLPEGGVESFEQSESLHRFAVSQYEHFKTCTMFPGSRRIPHMLSSEDARGAPPNAPPVAHTGRKLGVRKVGIEPLTSYKQAGNP